MRKKGLDPYSYMGEYSESGSTEDTYEFKEYDPSATVSENISLLNLKSKYLYLTSKYLTKLSNESGLTGTCMVSNRLERFANTQGCHPWLMIMKLNE